MKILALRNRQRAVAVDSRLLRRQAQWVLEHGLAWPQYQIAIQLLSPTPMARLNKKHLNHDGPTDILTFCYDAAAQHGELFICPAVAQEQAGRFRVTTRNELARYVIHGLLHMAGYDDKQSDARRKMKREENRLLRRLTQQRISAD